MKGNSWLAKLTARKATDGKENGVQADSNPGRGDLDDLLHRAAPAIPTLSDDRASRILAAALAASKPSAGMPVRTRRLIAACAVAAVCLAIALRPRHPSSVPALPHLATSRALTKHGSAAPRVRPIAVAPVITPRPGRRIAASRVKLAAAPIRQRTARIARPGARWKAHRSPLQSAPTQAQLARVLVVSVEQPPVKASSRIAGPTDEGYARVSAYATPDSDSGAMLEYTVAGPASGPAQTSFSLSVASTDSREAYLKVAVDTAGPRQTEGSNQ